MIYLLIDNTSLLQLASSTDETSDFVGELEHLVHSERIILISHQTLEEEWQTHRYDWKARADKRQKHLKSQGLPPDREELSKSTIYERNTSIIDKLLNNAHRLAFNSGLHNEVGDRILDKKAPFRSHGSVKDWNILGSFCLYCVDYGIKELHFISHNHKDFANPKNIKEIDPSIAERFDKVKINYIRNYSEFFTFIKQVELESGEPINFLNPKFGFANSCLASKKNERILDSLFQIFDQIYNELAYIPPGMLMKLYPFSKTESDSAYYSNFTGINVNGSLVEFFRAIDVSGPSVYFTDASYIKDCKDWQEKIIFVLERMRANQIFFLQAKESYDRMKIKFSENESSEDFEKMYYTFQFDKLKIHEKVTTSNPIVHIRRSYILFQLGELYESYLIISRVEKLAMRDSKHLLYLVCLYNLSRISNYSLFSSHQLSRQITTKLESINFQVEAEQILNKTNQYIVRRLQNDTFYYYALDKVTETVSAIEDHYYSQLRGGWSQNSNIQNLMSEFYQLEGFLETNGIIYNHYSNFTNLFQNVLKGLLCSYAISDNNGSRITRLDDYWIGKIISYGTRDSILKYIRQFNITSIKYDSLYTEFSFIRIAANLFDSFTDKIFNDYLNKNLFLKNKLQKYIENILTIGSFLELETKQTIQLFDFVVKHYTNVLVYHHFHQHFITLMDMRGKLCSQKSFIKLILFCSEKPNKDTIGVLISSLESSDGGSRNINKRLIKRLIEIDQYDQCNPTLYASILTELYRILPDSKKLDVHGQILLKCYKKEYILLTCSALSNDIVELNEQSFLGLFEDVDLSRKNYFGNRWDHQSSNFYITSVNHIVNVTFKFTLDTTKSHFDVFRSLSPYYSWLLDMDNFDYNSFEIEWLLPLDTQYSVDRMSKCKLLLSYLRENRENQRDERITVAIREIFARLIQ